MRWITGCAHFCFVIMAVIALIHWYEIERAYYCGPTPLSRCDIFSFGASHLGLSVAFLIGLGFTSLPWILARIRKTWDQPPGHGVFLMKALPTALFAGATVQLTQGRVGANDLEWISLLVVLAMMAIGVRGLAAFSANKPISIGPGWLISVIGLLILAAMVGFTRLILQYQDKLF